MTVIFVGLIAVFASVYLLVSSSVNGIKRKKEEYCAVVALLLYIRGALSSGGGRLCDMVRKFSSEPLEENGLLAVLRSDSVGNSRDSNEPETSRAFFRNNLDKVRFLVDDEDAKKLVRYLRGYGKSYIEEERKKLSEITDYFITREKSFSEKSERDIKTSWIVFAFAFVGAFILLI